MTAGACIQLLEPGTVSICNTGIPLLCIGCFILKRKRCDKGNMQLLMDILFLLSQTNVQMKLSYMDGTLCFGKVR